MPTRHAPPYRGRHRARHPARRRAAGLAGLSVATLAMLLALPGSAQAGPADLAAPGSRTHATIQVDLFRSFTNCLAEAAHGDSMYPGIDPAEVNACLGL